MNISAPYDLGTPWKPLGVSSLTHSGGLGWEAAWVWEEVNGRSQGVQPGCRVIASRERWPSADIQLEARLRLCSAWH